MQELSKIYINWLVFLAQLCIITATKKWYMKGEK